MSGETFDVAIIGAGVIGCAMARRLTLDGVRVIVLEKSLDVLDGASKGNSAILHTGFDAPEGTLEHACVTAGYHEYLEEADSLGLPILRSGAMVVAWSPSELEQLPVLLDKAHRNGISDVKILDRNDIRRREPNMSDCALGAIEVPGEYLIDPWTSAHAYILQALANGAQLKRGAEVLSGSFDGDVWSLETSAGELRAKIVINCAGLFGDLVDKKLLGRTDFTISPRKGQFLVFDKVAADLLSSTILSVPTSTTKGIVVCRTIFGNVIVGPTAEDQQSRTDFSTSRETLKSLRAKAIEIVPGLENCEVTAAYAGLRPATEYKDYQIRHHKSQGYVTIGGIRSTGLSSALGIARYVAGLLYDDGCPYAPIDDPHIPEGARLSQYHPRDWQCQGHGGIVCHCEMVTRREIEQALEGPMPPATLQGLKRRTRVTMGRCQGFYCTAELADITRGRLRSPIGYGDE